MEDILYVKVEQNIPVTKRELTLKDVATLYSVNKSMVQKLETEPFYTIPKDGQKLTMFTITKVYETIHKLYPQITIENLGEQDFIVEYEAGKKPPKAWEYVKAVLVTAVVFFGAAFTIMTFNEDVNVSGVFEKIYQMVTGEIKSRGSILEISYAIGMPIGIIVFYNHFKRRDIKNDPTPIQIEMRTYEEQMNKAMLKSSAREGKTIDVN
ncbi:MAG: stage V sporulation protein AA [Eubacterium sp.]|jgi:stage V sporulation protein AA|nr:stage V sporulation protein AA [Eubacterium sp.]